MLNYCFVVDGHYVTKLLTDTSGESGPIEEIGRWAF